MGQLGNPNANDPEGVAHTKCIDAEPDSMEGEVINQISGELDSLEGVAHMQTVDMELDLT